MKHWWKANSYKVNMGSACAMAITGIVLCSMGRWYGLTPLIVGIIFAIKAIATQEKKTDVDKG